ncbi:T9SS type A sorting domain-containing protein [Psychroflexus sp. C1]|uniref:T9SS type A sorting domain-containing protein n=1 Tax=Psychroflexus maritimus TaxID=2714865 RepID=A0A967E5F8_9FLAO|nr:T9SS type A sorting domain-containing protein [Psychroflexus maritimus]
MEYSIPDDERNASIMVFNMTGKLLKEFKLREKTGKIEITSDEFQPGIYLYSLISDNNEIITKKMIVK